MLHIWNFFVKRSSFTLLILVAFVAAGLYSVIIIPKESNPEIDVPIGIVTTVLPGASAGDVEELITDKIEEQLSGSLDEVKKIISTSGEGVSSVVVEFEASANIPSSIQDIKDEVDKVKNELPEDGNDPFVSEVDFSNEPILLFSIASDLPVTEFIELTDTVIDELKAVRGVSDVSRSGIPEREVQVVVRKEALNKFGVSLSQVVGAIRRANSALPVGSIQLNGIEYAVQFDGAIEDSAEIRDIAILNTAGEPVYLRDLAFVSDGVTRQNTFSRVSIGGAVSQQAVSFAVTKQSGGDITRISDAVKEKLTELEDTILKDTEVLISFDIGDFIKEDLRRLSFTGLQTVALVMVILFITIGWRESLVAGLAIPLSFLIGFIALNATGNTINFVSLFSLILAVGILVDSAIVVTEGIHLRIAEYPRRKLAALATIKEFHWPLTSGTMTTVAVFAPLFLVPGITGEFIASIPFTIIFVLLASLFVALGITPLVASAILRKRNARGKLAERQDRYTERFQEWYKRKLAIIVGHRGRERAFIVFLILLLVGSIALPITGAVKTIFFEQEDADFLFVEVETLQGTVLGETDLVVRRVEDILYDEPGIESFVATVGEGSPFANNGGGRGTKLGNFTLILDDERERSSTEILERLRAQFELINTADVRILETNTGPPTGAPILITFFGDNLDELEQVTVRAERLLNDIEGTTDVRTSATDDIPQFVLSIDRAKATEVGLDSATIAQVLRTAIHGLTATKLTVDGEDIDVVVKLNLNPEFITPHDTIRTTVDALRYIEIQTPQGPVLLGSLVTTELKKGNAVIRHEDRKRVLSVTSELSHDTVVGDVTRVFEERLDEVEIPQGVMMRIGGETEDVNESFRDMFIALIVGMILVAAILVLQFNSYRQAFFIIIIVPFTLIGIFLGLLISGKALSFPSMMGFIALSGIVVNNSIILVDRMNKLRRQYPHIPIKDVVILAAATRLRPILLTTLTTVIGIIPLTYASDLWAPLAYSIIFGLSFAVVITLILVPVLYNRWPGKLPEMDL